ncbi:ABC transporter ATP-binding protein [Allobranchiibius huperziae]|uniref:Putative ABC transport system ATP-binding protein n=1 Tax=Allobranchiibius huperziae TaxID=1874116 RepID=A0A853DJ91_9MICO|nr:ABC transporter ATP-binding protein [Allobranchiibius huperziae]NYJ76103.1 putative ABC transport system ATP-binding protein [Allobranchiibius huperziae]
MRSEPSSQAPVLSARSLVASYGRNPALKGVSLQLGRGEILAVTGPSGSGKSTLLMCLAGVVRPDAGEVFYEERRISMESEAERSRLRRRDFGVLFQFGQLVPELTAIENVALPLLLDGSRRGAAMAAATTWLERFEVVGLARTRPTEMSGGQAQRVAVARAMVTEPQVLFADEPTGALDSLNGEQVMTQMSRVVREAGTSVVLVTHDARVAAYGDREIQLRDGQIDGYDGAVDAAHVVIGGEAS